MLHELLLPGNSGNVENIVLSLCNSDMSALTVVLLT